MQNLFNEPFRNEIIPGESWLDYRAFPGMNPSTLVHGLKSMKHLRYEYSAKSKQSTGMLVGSATHMLTLEPDQFKNHYIVYEGRRDNRTKVYQAFLAEHEGKDILTEAESWQAHQCAKAVLAHTHARELIETTQHEVSIYCEDAGLQCKGRVDGIGNGILLDVKGTGNIEKYAFGRVFNNLQYSVKMALYKRWAESLGERINKVVIICHEQNPPFDVAVVPIPPVVLENGWRRIESVLNGLMDCINFNSFPGVAEEDEYDLVIPQWSMEDD